MASQHAVAADLPVVPGVTTRPVRLLLVFVVALLPLLATPLFPFIDLYNHLARYFVLAHIDGSAALQQDYASNWGLLPNIGLDVIGTALLHVVPPVFAAHLTITLLFAAQYAGVLAFNRALTGRTSLLVAVLLVPLLYSFILNWGFANFLFGLGLAFAAAAWWLRWRDRPALAAPVGCLFAVVIFFCHGLDFMLYGVLVASLELGLFLQRRERRPADLVRALLPVAVQAVVPAVLFAAAPTSKAGEGMTNADTSIDRLYQAGVLGSRLWDLFCYRLLTIVRVAEGPSLAFDIVTFIVAGGLIALLLARRRLTVAPAAWPAIAAATCLVVAMPPALFGVGYVADRMPLFLALVFVGALGHRPAESMVDRAATAALGLLVAVRLVAIAVGWQPYAEDWRGFRALATAVPPRAMVLDVMLGGSPHAAATPRCAMYRPLMVSLDDVAAPLFANETQQPLRIVGPLRRAMLALPQGSARDRNRPGFADDAVAGAGPAGFDYVLLCHPARLTRPLPAGAAVVAETPRLTLIRLAPVPRTH